MSVKVGETPILRGSPPVVRTLEVYIDEDWLSSEHLEKCVSFREVSTSDGRYAVIFSRSITSKEARAFAELLLASAKILDHAGPTNGEE
jgi:hypothetical protein